MKGSPANDFTIRLATLNDVQFLARHRCEMFTDMGKLQATYYDQLAAESVSYFSEALVSGEYIAWVVASSENPEQIVAGGGVHLRRSMPSIDDRGIPRPRGPQALIVNIYTEQEWRKRGLANLIMQTIIKWSKDNGITNLILHASEMGRPIYEKLGFRASNEMFYPAALLRQKAE